MAASSRQLIVNRDGYIVDYRSGVVVDDQPLCYDASCEVPPIRDRDEWECRLRAAVVLVRHPGEETQVVTFKLPKWLLELVGREVRRRGLTHRSELIRDALAFYLLRQDSVLAMVKRRGLLYAARTLLAFAMAYAPDEILRDDVKRVEEELEAAIKHFDEALAEAHRRLSLW